MKGRRQRSDRISTLPENTIEKILTHMPIRDALRTSILSSKWRHSWRTMPKLVFNDDSLVVLSNDSDYAYDSDDDDEKEIDKHEVVNAIFHVLLLHKGPILEFSLSVTNKEIFSEIDQIILYLSRTNNIKKFTLKTLRTKSYLLPPSFFSLQGLEHIDLKYCKFNLALMNKGFSSIKSLCFAEVSITNEMLFKFLTNCPLLEDFTWARDHCIIIELTECELVKLFMCLPSIRVLKISKLYITHLTVGSMPHKLPFSLPNLRILVLDVCFLELSSVLCVINSSPNLEKIKVELCWDRDERYLQRTFKNLSDDEHYTSLQLDHLKEMEITSFRDRGFWMEFVKFIMGKSPLLKKARIELHSHVSVDEELKMLRDLIHLPFPRASPAGSFTIERPKVNYRSMQRKFK